MNEWGFAAGEPPFFYSIMQYRYFISRYCIATAYYLKP